MRPPRPRALPAAAGLALLVALAPAGAAEPGRDHTASASALLTAASKAVRRLSYKGILVYANGGDLNTLRIFHRFTDGVEQERLVSMDGAAREIIRKDGRLVSILPDKHLVLISKQPATGLLNRVKQFSSERIEKAYTLGTGEQRRIAGRLCRTVSIAPKDDFRYGYRMLIDKKTRLPLKLELRHNEQILEKMLFSQIDYPQSMPDVRFNSSYDLSGFRVVKHQAIEIENARSAGPNPWHATKLPAGFRLAESGVRRVADDARVRQLLFSDGLATVSAFVAPAGLRAPLKGGSSRGAVNAYGRTVGDKQITVVGQVPPPTVKMIATHLARKSEAPN